LNLFLSQEKVKILKKCETKDLFVSEKQELAIDLNEMGSLKLSFTVQWKPFKGEDLPMCSSGLSAGYADLEPPPIPDGPVSADNVSIFFIVQFIIYIIYSLNNIYYFNNYFNF